MTSNANLSIEMHIQLRQKNSYIIEKILYIIELIFCWKCQISLKLREILFVIKISLIGKSAEKLQR